MDHNDSFLRPTLFYGQLGQENSGESFQERVGEPLG